MLQPRTVLEVSLLWRCSSEFSHVDCKMQKVLECNKKVETSLNVVTWMLAMVTYWWLILPVKQRQEQDLCKSLTVCARVQTQGSCQWVHLTLTNNYLYKTSDAKYEPTYRHRVAPPVSIFATLRIWNEKLHGENTDRCTQAPAIGMYRSYTGRNLE